MNDSSQGVPALPGSRAAVLAGTALLTFSLAQPSLANVWVFEPSASIDQRVDDNYRLDPRDPQQVVATRAIGSLSVSREAPEHELRAFFRVDGLLSINDDDTNQLTSNQILYLQNRLIKPRSIFDVKLSFKRDTPDRDISADVTNLAETAADTGASVTQDHEIDRQRVVLNPNYTFNLTRRMELDLDYSFTDVQHGETSCEDAIDTFNRKLPEGSTPEERPVFTVDPGDELDNFNEHAVSFGGRYKLSERSSFSATLGFSRFETEGDKITPDTGNPDTDRIIQNEECRFVLRFPKETVTSDTIRLSFGYRRQLSRTLQGEAQIGYYQVESDDFLLQAENPNFDGDLEPTTTTGYLLNLSLAKDAGVTQYKGTLAFDVFPSDVGSVVESLNVIGDVERKISPLLDAHFRIRAYEPDALGGSQPNDTFSRRFLSLEPRIIWRFSRAWTVAGSYRYRRQRSAGETNSAESNALLFTLKYTPPSAIADARRTQVDNE